MHDSEGGHGGKSKVNFAISRVSPDSGRAGGQKILGRSQVEFSKEGVALGIIKRELSVASGDAAFFVQKRTKSLSGRVGEADLSGKGLGEAGVKDPLTKFHIPPGFHSLVEESDLVEDGAANTEAAGGGVVTTLKISFHGKASQGVIETAEALAGGWDFDGAGEVVDPGLGEASGNKVDVIPGNFHIGVEEADHFASGQRESPVSGGVGTLDLFLLNRTESRGLVFLPLSGELPGAVAGAVIGDDHFEVLTAEGLFGERPKGIEESLTIIVDGDNHREMGR